MRAYGCEVLAYEYISVRERGEMYACRCVRARACMNANRCAGRVWTRVDISTIVRKGAYRIRVHARAHVRAHARVHAQCACMWAHPQAQCALRKASRQLSGWQPLVESG
eukprot:3639581-Pleurochrysis_carterae.AAC.1